ncbi:hypothetical protein [Pedobacter agri]|uniref:hypothetical protein n=1 Tax=Pedobacter agri TaxID=454586 RepID=UPI00292E6A3F|nr:hypothetical protein [Pedobacter agri]
MINLFTYLNLLKGFFDSHFQINTLLVGDKKDITGKSDIMYPLANIEYLDKSIREDEDIYRYEVIIADLASDESELIVISDCNSIADDLVTYFEDTSRFEELELLSNVTIKPFSDSFGDRVAGVTFTINMTGFRKSCDLSIPIGS